VSVFKKIILIAILPLQLFAKVALFENSKDSKTPLDWAVKEKSYFQKISEKASIYTFEIEIQIPSVLNVITIEAVNYVATFDKNILKLTGYSSEEIIKLKNSSGQTIKEVLVSLKKVKGNIVYDSCSKNFPELTYSSKEPLAFDVGFACYEKPDKSNGFSLSLPADAFIISSSIFDSEGKGERWRYYDLSAAALISNKSATFNYEYQGKPYQLELVNRRGGNSITRLKELEEEQKKLEDSLAAEIANRKKDEAKMSLYKNLRSLFAVELNLLQETNQLRAESDNGPVSKKSGGLGFLISADGANLYKKFSLNASLSTSLPNSNSNNSVSHLIGKGSISYEFVFGNFKVLPFGFSVYQNFRHPESNFETAGVGFGAGVNTKYLFSTRDQIELTFEPVTTSRLMKSRTFYQLGYRRRLFVSSEIYWLGAALGSEVSTLTNEANQKRNIDHSTFNVFFNL
jgi:hypothetical protein